MQSSINLLKLWGKLIKESIIPLSIYEIYLAKFVEKWLKPIRFIHDLSKVIVLLFILNCERT
jgi:hypothetical protein